MIAHMLAVFALVSQMALAAEQRAPGVTILLRGEAGEYEVVIRNAAAKSVFYTGYGGIEAGSPVYGIEVFRDGSWTKSPSGWCGVGLGECSIRSGGSLSQRVHAILAAGEMFRVVMQFSSVSGDRKSSSPVYSNPLTFIPFVPPPNPFLRSFPQKG